MWPGSRPSACRRSTTGRGARAHRRDTVRNRDADVGWQAALAGGDAAAMGGGRLLELAQLLLWAGRGARPRPGSRLGQLDAEERGLADPDRPATVAGGHLP